MEGGHLTMYSASCNTSPFPVSKQIQSIDPMIVSVHNVFENSTPSFGYCWNVRMVCIQSETDHSTAFQKRNVMHPWKLCRILHIDTLIRPFTVWYSNTAMRFEMKERKSLCQRASLHAVKHFWMYWMFVMISSLLFCLLEHKRWPNGAL